MTHYSVNTSQTIEADVTECYLLEERDLASQPVLSTLMTSIDQERAPVGYERLLYRHLFIDTKSRQYVRLILDEFHKLLIPLHLNDEAIYRKLLHYGETRGYQLLVIDGYRDWLAPESSLLPVGVWQDISIPEFTLEGGRMRKLRYFVQKFAASGSVRIEEYRQPSQARLVAMRDLMARWAAAKHNVIEHSFVCMRELLQQSIPPAHRVFLTHRNEELCSIIVIEYSGNGIYIMDQEFYDPATAPPGHMEYGIVSIMDQLRKEGAERFSLGLTWYPFPFDSHPHTDSKAWQWLKEHTGKTTLLSKVFEQGRSNYQFKKKFAPREEPVFAYFGKRLPYTALLKFWPVFMRNSLTADQLREQLDHIPLADNTDRGKTPEERRAWLEEAGSLHKLAYQHHPLDLQTDSWWQRKSAAVLERTAALESRNQSEAIAVLRNIFPFKHLILTRQGRDSEALFYRTFPDTGRKLILSTIPWTTTLAHQLGNGYRVVELPHPSALQPDSRQLFKGEIDMAGLTKALLDNQGRVSLVGIEVLSNASGGHPVRLAHLRELKERLREHRIPLVIDASRVVRNACLIRAHEESCGGCDLWDLVKRMLALGDHVVASLSKDFAVPRGGLVATNDDHFAETLRAAQQQASHCDRQCQHLTVPDQTVIELLIARQLAFAGRIGTMLHRLQIPVLQPVVGHAVVVDIATLGKTWASTGTHAENKARFLEDLFIETGIRAGVHQVGAQKNTLLDRCVRLAFPLGLSPEDEQLIEERLVTYFSRAMQHRAGNAPSECPRADIDRLPAACTKEQKHRIRATGDGTTRPAEVAIIGLSGKYPGAQDHWTFWHNLQEGTNFIRTVPERRWNHNDIYSVDSQSIDSAGNTTVCKFGSFLDAIETFDAAFFGLHPDEVRAMDPQERLALEVAWSCVEDAGYRPEQLTGEVGIFSGITYNEFQKSTQTTNHSCFVNSRIAFFFDFQGPSVSVDSGCCSSLTAIDLACQSLARGDCRAALVVGSNLLLHPHHYTSLSSLLSTTAAPLSIPFGNGDGWIPAEGVVAILLKPLARAKQDRDHVYAVIKSSRTRQEGRTSWFTAPNPRSQAELIRRSFETAGIHPETISYVEAAANGSALGDAVELEGLTRAFRHFTERRQFCPIGSVKANLGHGEAVSTLVQLTKVLLQFKSATLLPMPGAGKRNEKLAIETTPFYFSEARRPWQPPTVVHDGKHYALPRRATLSSFGGGGNMGHLILEEAPVAEATQAAATERPDNYCIPISSRAPAQLRKTVARFLTFFERDCLLDTQWQSRYTLANVMFTLCVGRQAFETRVAFIATNHSELIELLRLYLDHKHDPRLLDKAASSLDNTTEVKQSNEHSRWLDAGRRWVQGEDIDWAPFFQTMNVRRVPLPTFCFEGGTFPIFGRFFTNSLSPSDVEVKPKKNVSGEGQRAEAEQDADTQLCKQIFAEALARPVHEIDPAQPLDRYGFDSAMVLKISAQLEKHFQPVPQTLFFECRNLQDIIDAVRSNSKPRQPQMDTGGIRGSSSFNQEAIAIVGMAGRYPMANTPDELWHNLRAGRNCVTEIPAERWPWQNYFEPDRQKAAGQGKTYSKWGGFIDGHDRFDARFFNISPREAKAMDPQGRLFLETVWATIEDAGYTRASLEYNELLGRKPTVGVFVGSSWQEYPLHAGNSLRDTDPSLSSNACNIANRVSYWFGFEGTSLVLDTACSSSLVALHLACQSIRTGENDMAIAGAVNLSIHPNKYLALAQGQFLSSRGRCESFAQDGDGYVPGEGVGAILLKPESRALADRDHIYGLIRASAVNHGGRTNGYSVPDPNVQAAVIAEALGKANVDPREIGYIEAHGTGTALGDPIEIEGLCKAFRRQTRDKAFCAIGSVKSNIGHCEAAAGIAGITKILLQFKYGEIVPSLHAGTLNNKIDFDNSPFFVQRECSQWPHQKERRRIAGISSFGAGGTNAHVIVEACENVAAPVSVASHDQCYAIVLSARDQKGLISQARNLVAFMDRNEFLDLAGLAYTLQVGREAMEIRLAFIVSTTDTLKEKLKASLENRFDPQAVYRGQSGNSGHEPDDALAADINTWMENRQYNRLLELWVNGYEIQWESLWTEPKPRRISLPTYPFSGERHWFFGCTSVDTPSHTSCDGILCFEERWDEASEVSADEEVAGQIRKVLCFLSKSGHQQEMAQIIDNRAPGVQVIFVEQSQSPSGIQSIIERADSVDAVLYLWPVENAGEVENTTRIASILKLLAAAGAPRRILLAGCFADSLQRCHLESWIGFERSLKLAWPDTVVITSMQEAGDLDWNRFWLELVAKEPGNFLSQAGKRYALAIHPATPGRSRHPASRDTSTSADKARLSGTILITGGGGGLGMILAEHLTLTHEVNVVLMGRSPLRGDREARFHVLQERGCPAIYLEADVCDSGAMRIALERAKQRFGAIDGVIHAAGVAGAQRLFDKTPADFENVLAPKIRGVLVLEEVLADEPLQFVCYFSSTSAVLGDFGSCDYAVGNRFLMAYARHRNVLQAQGKRRGRGIVINWPLWREGGMGSSDTEGTAFYLKSSGQRALETQEGLDMLDACLADERTGLVVLTGDRSRTYRFLNIRDSQLALAKTSTDIAKPQSTSSRRRPLALRGLSVKQCVAWELRDKIRELLEIVPDNLDGTTNLADFGFDSVSLAQFARALSNRYGLDITPDLFFAHSTLDQLTDYFLTEHGEAIAHYYRSANSGHPPIQSGTPTNQIRDTHQIRPIRDTHYAQSGAPLAAPEPIAIIGMSGRFPKTRTVDELWNIFVEGINAVDKIPADRFDWQVYGEALGEEAAKFPFQWCGMVPGVAEFDPLFFEISPREAESMDPRQRLLLQEAWNALEDAAYGAGQIERQRIGMFVGVEEGDYHSLVKESSTGLNNGSSITSNHTGVLAARLAYFLNLKGPVMALNTACSSGLVAAHQACQSLTNGECDTALAAGISLLLTPAPLIGMAQAGMLSPAGECRAFDKRANGIVPGEAVAVVVLKRLSQAIADGDPIHATILGSGINHDGRTNGITAPNRVSQTELIREVHRKAGIEAGDIDYIIAHGTGTPLGDPVEINALNDAFKEAPVEHNRCALTSAKSNLGHTFAASGLVSLIAMVQSLRHRTIPASLHCEEESDYIPWARSPFYVNKENRPWPEREGRARTGAVSAFGMSGTNAHLVVREHTAPKTEAKEAAPWHLLVLSAKSEEALLARAEALSAALQSEALQGETLTRIAYTLLEGRHHFRHRCAIVVEDKETASYCTSLYVGRARQPNVFQGEVAQAFLPQKIISESIADMIERQRTLQSNPEAYRELLLGLAELYCQGYSLSGTALFPASPIRIGLPAYPFAREYYWPDKAPAPPTQKAAADVRVSREAGCRERPTQADVVTTLLARPVWREVALPAQALPESRRIVVSYGFGSVSLGTITHHPLTAESQQPAERFTELAVELFRLVKSVLQQSAGEAVMLQLLLPIGGRSRHPASLDTRTSLYVGEADYLSGLNGILQTACLENPALTTQLIEVEPTLEPAELLDILDKNCRCPEHDHIRYQSGRRQLLLWKEIESPPEFIPPPWKHNGVYLITGGCGGLGQIFARELATVPGATLILCGRSELSAQQRDTLAANIVYRRADVSVREEVDRLIQEIVSEYGGLDGVIHSAGVLCDSLMINKSEQALRRVLAPKVAGSVNLVRATQHLPLDFLVLFSSVAGIQGNPGQADYATANAFQDALAESLAQQRRIMSINWPLWENGGMGFDRENTASLRQRTGLVPLDNDRGIAAFYRVLASGESRVLVLCGEPSALNLDALTPRVLDRSAPIKPPATEKASFEWTLKRLTQRVAEHLKLPEQRLFPHEPLDTYGADSIIKTQLNRKLAQTFKQLSRTVLYEYPTLHALAEHLCTQFPQESAGWCVESEPIAIIGISGRFPQAQNLDAFWENLKAEKESIGEIPADRWGWREQWGGFLEDAYAFDPLFFNITPRDAGRIDPQERLFLEQAWTALEDAGYAPSRLPNQVKANSGVFAGITKQGFNLLVQATDVDYLATSFSSLVNRVSHELDFKGPSMAIDAMCASALMAVHEACEFLRYRGGELAVAGAVNLYLHPSTYLGLSLSQALASGPHCTAFAQGGGGFVPGEGVGVVVLKPYRMAVRDGDSIHAVILGSAANHGGKTGAYGTPNPGQQAEVIRLALARAGVDARSVSYIESAANGQEVGDAVETAALTKVFSGREGCEGDYRIGSVKPNIGHCESASGMSQLCKVILSLRHGTRVPTLIQGPLNADIDFDRLPFQLQRETEAWQPVKIDAVEQPRRAGITSLGAGGVSVHVIVEEPPRFEDNCSIENPPYLFVLSAKTRARLIVYAKRWLEYLQAVPAINLERTTYTLQLGREQMPCRLALVTTTRQQLIEQLQATCEGEADDSPTLDPTLTAQSCFTGESRPSHEQIGDKIAQAVSRRDLHELGRLWVTGADIPWEKLYEQRQLSRCAGLPTYPFERRPCRPGQVEEPRFENKAAEFYTLAASAAASDFAQEYLTFAPFPKKIPGFSVTRVCLNPGQYPDELALIQECQAGMRKVLFGLVDVKRIERVLDIGCGHGTDVIQFAAANPNLQAHGFTITKAQAELGNRRIRERGLEARVTILHADSSRDPFPEHYDLIIGVEVTFHIRDKARLFEKMSAALNEGGSILLADYIANTRGAIVDPRVEVTIPTRSQWIDLLADHGLIIDDIIDVSPEIANFLYDPEFEQHIRKLPPVGQDTWRNYVNQSAALSQKKITYSLIKLRVNRVLSDRQRRLHNEEMLTHQRPYPDQAVATAPPVRTGKSQGKAEVATILIDIFQAVLGLDRRDLQQSATFKDLGIGSVNAVELLEAINQRFDLVLPTSILFECDTLDALAGYLIEALGAQTFSTATDLPGNNEMEQSRASSREDIAIVGLSCRCAGAGTADELWDLIREGRECISDMPADWSDYLSGHTGGGEFPCRYGAMENLYAFDPLFFRVSPKEAEHMDLNQRLLLQESYRALEDAGYAPASLSERAVGTFIGIGAGSQPADQASSVAPGILPPATLVHPCTSVTPGVLPPATLVHPCTSHLGMLGSDTSIAASRLAHFLNLKGQALAINTACSSSLVAIDIACQALKSGAVDMALAGGITLWNHPAAFIAMYDAGMLSPDGRCRPFDNAANGIVVGDGVGIVVLRRCDDAVRDNDQIYGVIRGTGTNQDGRTAGITVPSFLAQSQLQAGIYSKHRICVEDIQYIESHGTATKMGDPIEVHALSESFARFTDKKRFCAMGSLKANIGHTAAAAGVLGLIKVLLCLKHRQLPPAINFERENEHIDFNRSPVYVNKALREWPLNGRGSRLAAVSSFGYSGTNAHLVVAACEAGTVTPTECRGAVSQHLILLSAQRKPQLREVAANLYDFLRDRDVDLAAVAYTLQVGRDAMDERLACVVENLDHLREKLAAFLEGKGRVGDDFFGGSVKRDADMLSVLTDEEMTKVVEGWLEKGNWVRLAELWVKGWPFDWARLQRSPRPGRISLPTYPFAREFYPLGQSIEPEAPAVARDRCRPQAIQTATARDGGSAASAGAAQLPTARDGGSAASAGAAQLPTASHPADDAPRLMCFEEIWQPVAATGADSKEGCVVRSLLCFLADSDKQHSLRRYMEAQSPDTKIFFISSADSSSESSWRVEAGNNHSCQEVFRGIAEIESDVDAMLYLWPLENPDFIEDAAGIAAILQSLRRSALHPRRIVLAGEYNDGLERSHLESWIGFERSIGLAWPDTRLTTLIRDKSGANDNWADWLPLLWHELTKANKTSVLYQKEKRCELQILPTQFDFAQC